MIQLSNRFVVSLLAATLWGLGAISAQAADEGTVPGYVVTPDGTIVTSADGSCVKTSSWEPEMVVERCDPELYAQLYPEPEPEPVEEVAVIEAAPAVVAVEETLDVQTLFGFDKAKLDAESTDILNELAQRLTMFESIESVQVTGYTDRIGPLEYNEKLSQQRAEAVASFLRENTDIPSTRFEVQGLGPADPVASCEGLTGAELIDCLAPNRRVEVEITAERTQATPGTF